jgi:hypothetical protein
MGRSLNRPSPKLPRINLIVLILNCTWLGRGKRVVNRVPSRFLGTYGGYPHGVNLEPVQSGSHRWVTFAKPLGLLSSLSTSGGETVNFCRGCGSRLKSGFCGHFHKGCFGQTSGEGFKLVGNMSERRSRSGCTSSAAEMRNEIRRTSM